MKFIKIKYFTLCLLSLFIVSACNNHGDIEIKDTTLDFTSIGLGAFSGNLMQNRPFAETENEVYLLVHTHIFRVSKASKQAIINCSNPGCQHNNMRCAAFFEPYVPMQVFNESVYIFDDTVKDVYYTIERGVRNVAGSFNGERSVVYYTSLIYKDRIYTFTDKIELEVRNLGDGLLVNVYPDCHLFIHGYFIEDDVIYFLNHNLELISIDINGENRNIIEGDRASYLMSYNDRLYFIQRGDTLTLYSMDKDGGNRLYIKENVMKYNIIEDSIFYTVVGNNNLYVMNLDGGNSRLLDINKLGGAVENAMIMSIGVYPEWGQVAITLYNKEALILISANGNEMQLIEAKLPPIY